MRKSSNLFIFSTSSSIDHTNNKANSYILQDLWWFKFTVGCRLFLGVYTRLEFHRKRNLMIYWVRIGSNLLILTLLAMVDIALIEEL